MGLLHFILATGHYVSTNDHKPLIVEACSEL